LLLAVVALNCVMVMGIPLLGGIGELGDFLTKDLDESLLAKLLAGPQTEDDMRLYEEEMAMVDAINEPDRWHIPTGFAAWGVCSAIFYLWNP